MRISRREVLRLGAALSASVAAQGSRALAQTDGGTLGAIAEKSGITFGTSIAADTMEIPAQAALYLHQARIFTVDWALMFGNLRPEANLFLPGDAEAILAFADAGNLPVHGHALAWNESRPDWLMSLSKAGKQKALDRHIDETVGYFAGRLPSWNVVNEPFWPGHGLDGGFRDGPWLQAFGQDYVSRAFKRAQAADPKARLVLNEAMAEVWNDDGAKIRAGLLRLVDRLQQDGVRLDAVGLQGHLDPARPYDDAGFTDFLHQLAERKIDIMITELDVDDSSLPDDIPTRDAAVAARYRDFLKAVLAVPAVNTVITWQLADSASWYDHAAREADPDAKRLPRPLPFDAAFRPKPAADAIAEALRNRRT
ncbi:endo-1,4-beta-xylanase [Kaistia defluvii]|uniref:endo-1,4-beta-xylanase n=1 Tax=Kaistia defluvii TaxID=410841 RepID=UPI002256B09F|nr:endo-1,4-beta-xylanase [Kaistia defluvii]MCX5519159.1 endo-1,4-beta-xylanase [Kaistia defluvii]